LSTKTLANARKKVLEKAALDTLIEIFFHLDVHLNEWIGAFGPWIYLILFLIVFCETGLVVTPFLPGDSLLFALGTLAATDQAVLKLPHLMILLATAAILGDGVNYAIGRRIGPKVFQSERRRWLNKRHLVTAEAFYERHGGKTILIARFLPILRTFAPFVAGIGKMNYTRFAMFNVSGGLLWIFTFLLAGYFFGNIPAIKRNFELVILTIIVLSCLPVMVRFLKTRPFGSIRQEP
jgi:membrane-associated protein